MQSLGFIGIGNMGGAMASAVANLKQEVIYVYDTYEGAYEKFSNKQNVIRLKSIQELVQKVKYIMLSIKPQYYSEVCEEIKKYLTDEHVVVTVSPGHSLKDMQGLLGEEVKLVRTMPNTPALVGAGITAYTFDKDKVVKEEISQVVEWLDCFGKSIYVEEKLMSAVVAVSGSSPAYGYMFIEAMADAAVSFGMPRNMAYEMSAMAIKGACEMVLETGKHPGELKDAVTSPGGTTIQAVTKLEECGFRSSIIKAMTACYEKSEMMSKH